MNRIIQFITLCTSIGLVGCTGNYTIPNHTSNPQIKTTTNPTNSYLITTASSTSQDSENLSWHIIGSPRFSSGGTDNEKIAVAPDGTIYVAYADYSQHNRLVVMFYNESNQNWNKLGSNPISLLDASDISMVSAPNGSLYIAFTDAGKGNKAVVMTYDKASSNWKTVGDDVISAGKANFTNIIVDVNSKPYLAYSDLENSGKTKVVTYDKNSNSWKAVGDFATTANSKFNSMAFAPDGTLYLVCSMYDFNMGRALVKSYDKSSQQWNIVGDIALSNGVAQYTSIAVSPTGVPYITFADQGNDNKAKVMAYDKELNHWRVIATAGISVGSSQYNNIAIAPDGKVEIVFKDAGSSNKATALYYDNTTQSWKPLSSNSALISEDEANHISLTLNKDGLPYVAYSDNSTQSKQVTVIGYIKPAWYIKGKPGFIGMRTDTWNIAADNNNIYIPFKDGDYGNKISVIQFSKITNNWQYLGSRGFTNGEVKHVDLETLNNNLYITFLDVSNSDKISVMTYNKETNQWLYVGQPGFSKEASVYNTLALANDGNLYVAFTDQANNSRLSVMKYNKSNNQWQYLGNPGFTHSIAWRAILAVTLDNTLYIAFYERSINNRVSVMRYNPSNNQWLYVGQPGFAPMPLGNIAVAPDNSVYVAIDDQDNNKNISVMKFNSANNQWQGSIVMQGVGHKISNTDMNFTNKTSVQSAQRTRTLLKSSAPIDWYLRHYVSCKFHPIEHTVSQTWTAKIKRFLIECKTVMNSDLWSSNKCTEIISAIVNLEIKRQNI